MKLPDSYESISGAVLAAARGAVRRNPKGVSVQAVAPVRIQVALVPVVRTSVPRQYGPPLESEVHDHPDGDTANAYALERVKAYAADHRVRAGRLAAVARRIGGQS